MAAIDSVAAVYEARGIDEVICPRPTTSCCRRSRPRNPPACWLRSSGREEIALAARWLAKSSPGPDAVRRTPRPRSPSPGPAPAGQVCGDLRPRTLAQLESTISAPEVELDAEVLAELDRIWLRRGTQSYAR